MLAPQVLSLPHFLEDQFVWLSIGSWCVLLTWLRSRVSRRRLLMWAGLAGALHLTPVTAQVIRATSALSVTADDMPFAFWALQALNVAVLAAIIASVCFLVFRRRAVDHRPSQAVQAVIAERRRIASDLHDGVGSRLVALLASQDPRSAGPGSLSMALQDCLLELQMTVDDLDDQTSASVVERLAHVRYRLQPAFDRLGIALEWHIASEAHARWVPPETAMQICRVAQEAMSNALRHAQATRVELRFGLRDRGLLMLEVRDNGRGLGSRSASSTNTGEGKGKGLRSMRSRADAIGGELTIENAAPRGLSVQLVVPSQAQAGARAEAESML
ncbi:sensor histidine kinase [Variovorax sp. ZT5P49]|uniref:sensor histidine kinase n=1 Tax=Variovorax sp. ZT5P49 TaxID=3443733 RepID=UPI003F47C5B4